MGLDGLDVLDLKFMYILDALQHLTLEYCRMVDLVDLSCHSSLCSVHLRSMSNLTSITTVLLLPLVHTVTISYCPTLDFGPIGRAIALKRFSITCCARVSNLEFLYSAMLDYLSVGLLIGTNKTEMLKEIENLEEKNTIVNNYQNRYY